MDKQNIKMMVAAALGAVGGLLLGLYLWGDEENKGKLSKHLSNLSDIVKELEEVGTEEAKNMKEKVSKLIKSVEKVMDNADGKS
jgi:hypothetical protein